MTVERSDDPDVVALSEALKRWQLVSGLTLRQIAARTGVDHVTVHRAVSGAGGVGAGAAAKLRALLAEDELWPALASQLAEYRRQFAPEERADA